MNLMEILANFAWATAALFFLTGLIITSITGAARPVKRLLAIMSGIIFIALVAGLIVTRGLLIYLTFQIIAFLLVMYMVLIAGAVCGSGIYTLMHKKAPGKALSSTDLESCLSAVEFSGLEGITEERTIARLKSGFYQGGMYEGSWYVHKSELSSTAAS